MFFEKPWIRVIAVSCAFMLMEAVRAPFTVFPLLNQHFLSIGVSPPADVSEWGAVTWVVWLIWLAIAIACIIIFSDLNEYKYGSGWSSMLRAASLVWAATFGIIWLSMFNLDLASAQVLAVALPGSLLEVIVLCWITFKWPHQKDT